MTLKRRGIAGLFKGVKFTPERDHFICEERRSGKGPRQIAREMNVSPGLVLGVLDRNGMCQKRG